jgi:hypothetical protein
MLVSVKPMALWSSRWRRPDKLARVVISLSVNTIASWSLLDGGAQVLHGQDILWPLRSSLRWVFGEGGEVDAFSVLAGGPQALNCGSLVASQVSCALLGRVRARSAGLRTT